MKGDAEKFVFHGGKVTRVPLDITHTSTPSSMSGFSPASERLPQCKDCNSPHGHKYWCPMINRNTAEAWSVTTEDRIRASALGVKL